MIPQFTATDFFVLKPILLLSLFGCGILVLDFLIEDSRMRWWNAMTALLGEIITGVAIWQHQQDLGGAAIQGLGGSVVVDGFSVFCNWLFLGAAGVAFRFAVSFGVIEGEYRGE
jgi:hypothetical protein